MGKNNLNAFGFSTLKILATVKLINCILTMPLRFSTLKILATVKLICYDNADTGSFSTLKILAYKYEMISND